MKRTKKIIPTCLSLILFFSIFTIFYPIENAKGDTLHVGEGQTYSTIQAAINAANISGGDTIYVHSGTYPSPINIDRPLILTGEGSATTIISGSNAHTVKVIANNVSISGFKLQNSGGSYYCVFLDSVTSCEISNNNVRNGGHGIYLDDSNNITIKENIIESNNIGIYLFNSYNNIIRSNNIYNNNANGIWLTSNCNTNTIYLNDFSGNMDSNARDYGSNNWDYNSQGNYWDDYNNYDSNGDGIGDNPYTIEGGGNKDNYPLGDFLSSNQQPVAYIDSISPNPASIGDTIYFNGHGIDDGSIVAWEWRANSAIISYSGDFSKTDFSSGTYSISFRVQDNNGEWSAYVYNTLTINANQKPSAYIIKPTKTTALYGETIQFQGQGTDPDGQVIGFLWRSTPEGIYTGENSFITSNLAVGQYTIYFKVRDNDGEWSSEVSTILTILSDSPNNQPPIADAQGPYTGYVNQSITFDGSSSYDPDNGDTITSYKWDFGDGSTGEGSSVMHNYSSEGNYTIELTVMDSHGEKTSSITYSTINSQDDSQNGNNENNEKTPGFDFIFMLFVLAIIIIYKHKKRK